MEKLLLSGNEAIALGAYEAGAIVGTGYPGTPSSEILEALTSYPGVYTEWSVNEKVAFEVALGAVLAGARTLVTMKHVGLNVAADPLFTSSYTGIKAGLVIVTADDPQIHSSQNEQDNRNYAAAAKIPMLEPADSQEAKDFTELAFVLSERYDTPVLLRTTTRISHSMTVVTKGKNPDRSHKAQGFKRNREKYVMIPAHARARHSIVEQRMRNMTQDSNNLAVNRMELADKRIGIITSGVSYTYVKEVLPEASVLKLGMVYPLPEKLIREFAEYAEKLIIVEELDPFFELRIKAMGLAAQGKQHLPLVGELSPDTIRSGLKAVVPQELFAQGSAAAQQKLSSAYTPPPRPPALCPGCPHRTVFTILKKLDLIVTGDIGCYTLGVLPPFSAMDTCVEMGGSVGMAQGMEAALGSAYNHNTVAVIGDSTFAHSGVTGLINAAYNKHRSVIIVLDNETTAMTGMQPNPLSGQRINKETTVKLDYLKLAEAMGIKTENVHIVDAYAKAQVEEAITASLNKRELSLIVVQGPCIILKRKRKKA
ncbi:MAG: indolepyruvate ferredoxin oxidoreductase subunit alpha [Spirochaetales bacterium]|nr:indolepyruvate ferredoxin oxidoreductase subunit alpha [Spirochaetales bacterium]